jgi:hypothetical protein
MNSAQATMTAVIRVWLDTRGKTVLIGTGAVLLHISFEGSADRSGGFFGRAAGKRFGTAFSRPTGPENVNRIEEHTALGPQRDHRIAKRLFADRGDEIASP